MPLTGSHAAAYSAIKSATATVRAKYKAIAAARTPPGLTEDEIDDMVDEMETERLRVLFLHMAANTVVTGASPSGPVTGVIT